MSQNKKTRHFRQAICLVAQSTSAFDLYLYLYEYTTMEGVMWGSVSDELNSLVGLEKLNVLETV